MMKCLFRRFILATLCTLYLPALTYATPSDSSWSAWFINQINQHPDVISAKEKMNAAYSQAEGQERPLYNPELETGYEREGDDNNYNLGINQTVDWWDKQGTRKQQASFNRASAGYIFELTLQQKMTEALQALVKWQAANKLSKLAIQQEKHLSSLLDLVIERQQAGDLSQVDAELTFLGLSQKLNATAQAQVQLKQTEAHLKELLPNWSTNQTSLPTSFWSVIRTGDPAQWIDQHPAVAAAMADWEILQQSSELARLNAKADPTFGLSAGKNGDDNIFGVTLSLPLNIRNNFSASVRSANQETLAAEANYYSVKRKQQFAIEASQATLHEYRRYYDRWKTLMQGRGERSGTLLEKQWRSGDMSTTEYLLALQQRTEGLIAGIELESQLKLSSIDLLLQTGQINSTLTQLMQ